MAKPGPEKRFDTRLDFNIESEYAEMVDKVAAHKGVTRAAILRRLVKENLSEFVNKEDEQQNLLEELQDEDF